MKINKLELFNFKQYYGGQVLHFAGYESGDDQNVTVIYGENGKGKTTIYRALMFALFGSSEIAKDKELGRKGDKFFICNLSALQESPDGSAMATVKVHFSHQGERFEVERVIVSQVFDDGQIQEDVLSVKLLHTDIHGKTTPYDREDEIERIILRIFDKRMKDYFLFDGERIDQLMRDDKSQKEEVAKGIKNVLKIDALEDAVQALNSLYANYHREVQNAASGEYRVKLVEQKEKEQEISKLEQQIEQWREEQNKKDAEIKRIDEELKKYSEISEKVYKREHLTQQLKQLNERKKEQLKKIRDFNKHSFNLIMKTEYDRLYSEIEHQRANLDNPYDLAKEFLEKILDDRKCAVCDSRVERGSDQYRAVSLLLEKHQENSYIRELNMLKEEIRSVMERNKASKERMIELLHDHKSIDKEIREVEKGIKAINDEIGESTNLDFKQHQQARNNLSARLGELKLKINQGQENVSRMQQEKKEIDAKVRELGRKEEQKNTKIKKKDTVRWSPLSRQFFTLVKLHKG